MIDRLRLLGGYQSIFIIVIDIDIELFPHIECSFTDSDGINNCCFFLILVSLNANIFLELFRKKYNIVGLKLFGLWLCNVGCAQTLHFAFHYVLKITHRP